MALARKMSLSLTDGYGARFYDLVIARWTSVDPLVEFDQENTTPYGYVYNNPIKNTDPDGRYPDGPGDDEVEAQQKGFWRPSRSNDYVRHPIGTFFKDVSFQLAKGLGLNAIDDKIADIQDKPGPATKADKQELGFKIFDAALTILSLPEGGEGKAGRGGNLKIEIRPEGTKGAARGSLNATKEALAKAKTEIGLKPTEALTKGEGKFGSPQRGTSKKGYRLDPAHPNAKLNSGEEFPHVNYWDYTKGKKGRGGVNGASPIKN